jgi:hypothetical protein
VEREHVLHDELSRIAVLAVDVLLDVESDNVVALGKKPLGPAAQAAEQVNGEGLHQTADRLEPLTHTLAASSKRTTYQPAIVRSGLTMVAGSLPEPEATVTRWRRLKVCAASLFISRLLRSEKERIG